MYEDDSIDYFWDFIADTMAERQLTQATLARRLLVNPRNVQAMLKKRPRLRLDTAMRWLRALGVTSFPIRPYGDAISQTDIDAEVEELFARLEQLLPAVTTWTYKGVQFDRDPIDIPQAELDLILRSGTLRSEDIDVADR